MPPKLRKIALVLLVALLTGLATGALARPYGSRSLARGAWGRDVAELQRRLRDMGYLNAEPDGMFGPITAGAVAAFQLDQGLPADGAAGPWTLGALDRSVVWRNGVWHQVSDGDTLAAIAARLQTDAATLRWLNRLATDAVQPGQMLRVPARPEDLPGRPAGEEGQGAPGEASPGAGQPGASPPAQAIPPRPPALVLAYYTEDWEGDRRSLESLRRAGGRLHLVASFQYNVDARGNLRGRDFPNLLALARDQGQQVLALVHNYEGSGFNRQVVRELLATPASREQAAARMAEQLYGKGFAGVNVDLENVDPAQRAAYTDFIARLGAYLRAQGMQVTLSVPAKTRDDPKDGWSGAFDYRALAPLADLIVIMSYDENTPGWPAGPVASAGWVERVAAYAAAQIPPEKLLLGIPQYGYDWIKGTTQGRALGVPAVLNLASSRGAGVQWDETARVPYFGYTDDSGRARVVYFENARSMAEKLAVVRKYGLRGVGIWRLGLEDPAIWDMLGGPMK